MSRRGWAAVWAVAIALGVFLAFILINAVHTGDAVDETFSDPSNALSQIVRGTVSTRPTPGMGPSGNLPSAKTSTDPASGLPWVAEAALPLQAAETLRLIDAGGPYPYPEHDDQVFGNYEGLLPDEPRGYYREYTVETPGSSDRGARRIIVGEGGEYYYTGDHYQSFARIAR